MTLSIFIIPLTVQDPETIKQKYPKGFTAQKPYLRLTPQPNVFM